MRKFLLMAFVFAGFTGLTLVAAAGHARSDDKKAEDKPKEKLKTDIEVPYVPTEEAVVTAMLKLAGVKEGDIVYDLGCGDGRIVITAVKDFKAKKGLGIDFDPARLKDCQERMVSEKLTPEQMKRLTFKQGDVLKMTPEDFKDVDVVTLYLLPSVNDRLQPILKKGLKSGARVVSHDFPMTDWPEDKKEEVEATRRHTIYLWTIQAAK